MFTTSLSGISLTQAQQQFAAALPIMKKTLHFQFRLLPRQYRAEAVDAGVAACWLSWHGLVRRGKDPLAVGLSGIAYNASRYVRGYRKLGCGAKGRGAIDVYDRRACRRGGYQLISLDRRDEHVPGSRADVWREWLCEDGSTGPADMAAFRLDFASWLARLPERKRQAAELLAQDYGTGEVARKLGVTPAAVSQARTWLEASWRVFQGETG